MRPVADDSRRDVPGALLPVRVLLPRQETHRHLPKPPLRRDAMQDATHAHLGMGVLVPRLVGKRQRPVQPMPNHLSFSRHVTSVHHHPCPAPRSPCSSPPRAHLGGRHRHSSLLLRVHMPRVEGRRCRPMCPVADDSRRQAPRPPLPPRLLPPRQETLRHFPMPPSLRDPPQHPPHTPLSVRVLVPRLVRQGEGPVQPVPHNLGCRLREAFLIATSCQISCVNRRQHPSNSSPP
jgi:hypothetical protein